jgi:hypothetical protein
VREPGPKSEAGWPSRKLRLTLLISFGGLLALMVVAGLDALRLARQGNCEAYFGAATVCSS